MLAEERNQPMTAPTITPARPIHAACCVALTCLVTSLRFHSWRASAYCGDSGGWVAWKCARSLSLFRKRDDSSRLAKLSIHSASLASRASVTALSYERCMRAASLVACAVCLAAEVAALACIMALWALCALLLIIFQSNVQSGPTDDNEGRLK